MKSQRNSMYGSIGLSSVIRACTLFAAFPAVLATTAESAQVSVTFTNDGPENGIWFVSPWVGFHDGTYDLANPGEAASAGIEAIAEDGNTGPLDTAFMAAAGTAASGTLGGPTAPGQSQTYVFDLDPMNPDHRYMSYALMLIPSNDAFVVNSDPMAVEIFDADGNFVAPSISIPGSRVYDAGTEVNDEIPANTAFLAQMAPNTGTTENGVITMHPGFNAVGMGGILDASTMFGGTESFFSAGDFTQEGYTLARITISMVNNADSSSDLLNISTRGMAAAGSNTQIAGFVVSEGDDMTVLVRGIGPGLDGFGVEGTLTDPTVTIFDAEGNEMATNDDWGTQGGGTDALAALNDAMTATGAFELGAGSADAALVATLPSGSYTAQVVTKGAASGVALVEVYEVP